MAGTDSNKVFLLGPDQSTTTGAIQKAATSVTAPTDARATLTTGW